MRFDDGVVGRTRVILYVSRGDPSSEMPRCLMAKKWKVYPWTERIDEEQTSQQLINAESSVAAHTDDEEIDVVGDADLTKSNQGCWGPHSPTAGATAPSPPPLNASGALYYHGELDIASFVFMGTNKSCL